MKREIATILLSLILTSCNDFYPKDKITGKWRIHRLCADGSYFDSYLVLDIQEDTTKEITFPKSGINFCLSELTNSTVNLPNPCIETTFDYSFSQGNLILDSTFIGFRVTNEKPIESVDYFASLELEIDLPKTDSGQAFRPISNSLNIYVGQQGQFRNNSCPEFEVFELEMGCFPDDTIMERFQIPNDYMMKVGYELGTSADILGNLYANCDRFPDDAFHVYLNSDKNVPQQLIYSISKLTYVNRPNVSLFQGFTSKNNREIVFKEIERLSITPKKTQAVTFRKQTKTFVV